MKKKKVLFGVPLEQIIKDKELSSDGIPKVVRECCEYLSKYALRTEGLFRVDGSEVEVQKLVNSYNAGKRTDLSKAKDHFVVGTLFKRFLGKLPQSLITKEFYEKAFEFRDAPIDEQVKGWRALLDAIDGGPRQIIKFVFAFLKNVERNEGFNMMSATNLGIVFGPCLIKVESASNIMDMIQKGNELVAQFISHFEALFEVGHDRSLYRYLFIRS
mmetsp:Transcript_15839/g.40147  ORF Transcript_15839/g.40147 Transcript_15839/m.40147 type:complete len:215 (-) Transcript_15839:2035-2679(-)